MIHQDDVARNIRNEQMADAAPTPQEQKEMHDKFLSENGCLVCGETDPENLTAVNQYIPNCSSIQHGPPDPNVFCHEHARNPSELYRARQFARAYSRKHPVAVVFYDCENVGIASTPTTQVRDSNGNMKLVPERRTMANINVRCRCGAEIDEICYL